jgi:hypothetical protein
MVSDDAPLKWTFAERKMIVQKYGTPSGNALAHAALLSDVSNDDSHAHAFHDMYIVEECTDEYDGNDLSFPFKSIAFSSSLAPSRDLSQFWVTNSACSINLTSFRNEFVTFDPPLGTSRVAFVGVDVKDYGTYIIIPMVSGQFIRRKFHALYAP